MKMQVSVYLEQENRLWLQQKSKKMGLSVSGVVSMLVSKERQSDPTLISEVNRSLENARVADLKNQL